MIFHVVNYACLNRSDELNLIIGKLEKDNHIMTDHIEKADYIFVYTCGSTEAFIKRSYDATIDILKKHPLKKVVVCGCSAVTAFQLYKDLPVILCSPRNFKKLYDELGIDVQEEELKKAYSTSDVKRMGNTAIVVQKGCVRKCTYCSIWMAIGKIISKNMDSVIQEVTRSVNEGKYDITITGDCIADYGVDTGTTIIELISRILSVSPKIKLTIYDVHPQAFLKYSDSFIQLAKEGAFAHLGIPIQSGSQKILKNMHRSFEIDEFKKRLNEIKSYGVELSTDIIVGFPGESDEDFEQTINLLKDIEFDDISVNMYTDTFYNASRKMTDKVSNKEILKRYVKLKDQKIKGINEDFFEYQFMQVLRRNK